MSPPAVSVVRSGDFPDLRSAVAQAITEAGLQALVRPGSNVLVKPNYHGGHGFTAPEVVAAVVEWARSASAGEVVVGEGPVYAMADWRPYFQGAGLARACEAVGVTLVCFHDGEYDVFEPGLAALPQTLGLTRWLAWADVVINVPVMKTHFNTLTTLAIKNLKGFLRPQDKRDLHKLDLHLAIAALASLIRPHINVMDATVAYEGMGPAAATPVDMGLLLASGDIFALDCVANWLMGFEPCKVRYLREAERLGLGQVPPDDARVAAMTTAPEAMAGLRRRFVRPYETARDDYPGLDISAEMACSGCLMNLFTALSEMRAATGFTPRGRIAIGRVPDDQTPDLALGGCTFSCWERAPYANGCPPTIEDMKRAITENLAAAPAAHPP